MEGAGGKAKGDLVVEEVITSDVARKTIETRLSEATALMVELKIGCLPVLEGGSWSESSRRAISSRQLQTGQPIS